MNAIGNALAEDGAYPLDGTFLYSEAEAYMIDASIFKDLGNHLVYREAERKIFKLAQELWDAESEGKRWWTMQYRIVGDTFEASFTHEPPDPETSTIERREIILRQHYGNKRIVYPSLP